MWRKALAFSALVLFGAGLTGCAINRFERREAWRDQAEQMCIARKLVQPTAYVSLGREIDGPGPCGMQQPFRVTRLGNGTVALKQRMTLGCPALAEAEAWLADTIQPAANLYFGVPVAEINAGSYSCRGRNNQVGAKLSEHSFGNAVDIMSFTLADGHVITVKGGWRGTEAEQAFLREVFVGACARFSTVLAPGSNVFHYDHIHVDLAMHDPRGLKRICKPLLKFESQLTAADGSPRPLASPRPPARQTVPSQAPIDVEEDDPYGIAPTSARTTGTRVAHAPVSHEPVSHAPAAPAPTAYTASPPSRPRSPVPAHDAAYEPLSLAAPGPSSEPIY